MSSNEVYIPDTTNGEPRQLSSVRAHGRGDRFRRKLTPYVFLSPFLLGYIAFMVYPLIYSFSLSLYRKQLIGGTTYIGLANYLKVIKDAYFWEGIRNVLTFGVIQIPVMLGLALIFAVILDSKPI